MRGAARAGGSLVGFQGSAESASSREEGFWDLASDLPDRVDADNVRSPNPWNGF